MTRRHRWDVVTPVTRERDGGVVTLQKSGRVFFLDAAEKLIRASRLRTGTFFYQDALLSLRALRLIQNATAQVPTETKRRDHISPVLATRHRLPMTSRVELKLLLPTYTAVHGLAPSH